MTALRLREVLPRDGFQDLDYTVPADVKKAVIDQLAAVGLHWIEVSSMVHPQWVPQFTDAEDIVAHARGISGLTVSVFVPNRRGLERALSLGVDEVSLAVAATDGLSRSNFRMGAAEHLQEVLAAAGLAAGEGVDASVTIGGAFGCPFEGEVAAAYVAAVAARIAASGVRTVFVADTIGTATPPHVDRVFAEVAAAAPGVAVGAHFHGGIRAIANVEAAVDRGAAVLDSALAGFGGCPFVPDAPGNVPTEAVAAWMQQRGIGGAPDPVALSACAARVAAILDAARPDEAGIPGHG